MIPKKIHYCWFGRGEKPKLAVKCIESWKKYCPDYEIIEWNEDNFDVYRNEYTRMCYEEKKYAFLTDYIRLLVIEEHGGIYFDTDVEVIRSFDDLLDNTFFVGRENDDYINTGLGFGAEPHNTIVREMLSKYNTLLDGKKGMVGCPILNTQAFVGLGMRKENEKQVIEGGTILPSEFLNPYDSVTGVLKKTSNTYSIHWYSMSWLGRKQRLISMLTRPLHRVFGCDCFRFFKKLFHREG